MCFLAFTAMNKHGTLEKDILKIVMCCENAELEQFYAEARLPNKPVFLRLQKEQIQDLKLDTQKKRINEREINIPVPLTLPNSLKIPLNSLNSSDFSNVPAQYWISA